MAYFKIGEVDFSKYVSALKIGDAANYNAQTNAAGDTVVEYINRKRTITVGIITVDAAAMIELQNAIDAFSVTLSFRNPKTNELVENVKCIIPANEVEYYTIQTDKVLFKAYTLTFTEL